jgi:hypothetical protein
VSEDRKIVEIIETTTTVAIELRIIVAGFEPRIGSSITRIVRRRSGLRAVSRSSSRESITPACNEPKIRRIEVLVIDVMLVKLLSGSTTKGTTNAAHYAL